MFDTISSMLATFHGAFLLGISSVILYRYFRRVRYIGDREVYLLCVVLGSFLTTICTMYSIYVEKYPPFHPWFLCCFMGYVLKDIGLVALYKQQKKQAKRNIA